MRPLYFDYNATTPVSPEVFEAMRPLFQERFGNPGSPHAWGLAAREALDTARGQVAALINAGPDEIVFTSCATESNNMALLGLLRDRPGARLVTSAVEHPAVLRPARFLQERGADVDILAVDGQGLLDPKAVARACEQPTRLVSVMLANNETGALQPVAEIAKAAHAAGALLHTDAAQACGKIPVDVRELDVDFLTLAGHKLSAPKGVGALYLRRGLDLPPLLLGGGQERGLRSGTENVALAVGLGAACALAARGLEAEAERQRGLGRRLLAGLGALDVEFLVHAKDAARLPNTLSVGFRGLDAGRLVEGLALRDAAVSAGAACHAGESSVSHVLTAMGAPLEYAQGTLRFSWGRSTTADDVDELLARLDDVLLETRDSGNG
jgi:cysteine desulfurase